MKKPPSHWTTTITPELWQKCDALHRLLQKLVDFGTVSNIYELGDVIRTAIKKGDPTAKLARDKLTEVIEGHSSDGVYSVLKSIHHRNQEAPSTSYVMFRSVIDNQASF